MQSEAKSYMSYNCLVYNDLAGLNGVNYYIFWTNFLTSCIFPVNFENIFDR